MEYKTLGFGERAAFHRFSSFGFLHLAAINALNLASYAFSGITTSAIRPRSMRTLVKSSFFSGKLTSE
jgi:hypothetical protein